MLNTSPMNTRTSNINSASILVENIYLGFQLLNKSKLYKTTYNEVVLYYFNMSNSLSSVRFEKYNRLCYV